MFIDIVVTCKREKYSYEENEVSERKVSIELNDRQAYSLTVGNVADAMVQDAAVELMSKDIKQELSTE